MNRLSTRLRPRLLGSLSLAALLLAGCQDFKNAAVMQDGLSARANAARPPDEPVVETVHEPYLLGEAVAEVPREAVELSVPVTLVIARPTSLRDVATRITEQTGLPVDVESDADGSGGSAAGVPAQPISFDGMHLPAPPSGMVQNVSYQPAARSGHGGAWLHYSGSRQGLLDEVATRFGVYERYQNGRVDFFRTETKTFQVPALNRALTTKSVITASAGADSGSGGGGGGSGSSTSSNGTTTIEMDTVTDIWKNIQKTAETVSGGASIATDPSLGTVTVTGNPTQVRQVREWADELGQTLMKQVAMTIHVYTIKRTHEQNYAWSPTLALQAMGKTYGLTVNPASAPQVLGSATAFSFGATILNGAKGALGQFTNTNLIANALSTAGDTSESYDQSVVAMNGMPAPLQSGQKTGYLASASTVLATNAGSSTSLLPGTVTSGFTGMFTPKIIGDRILLAIDLDIQTLLSIQTITSSGASIQVPITSNTTLHQGAMLNSGAMLVVTGFANDNVTSTRNGVGSPSNWILGGGGDAQIQKQLVVITIEARIL